MPGKPLEIPPAYVIDAERRRKQNPVVEPRPLLPLPGITHP